MSLSHIGISLPPTLSQNQLGGEGNHQVSINQKNKIPILRYFCTFFSFPHSGENPFATVKLRPTVTNDRSAPIIRWKDGQRPPGSYVLTCEVIGVVRPVLSWCFTKGCLILNVFYFNKSMHFLNFTVGFAHFCLKEDKLVEWPTQSLKVFSSYFVQRAVNLVLILTVSFFKYSMIIFEIARIRDSLCFQDWLSVPACS